MVLVPLAPLALGSCLGVLCAVWGWGLHLGVFGALAALLFLVRRNWILAAGLGCLVLCWGIHRERLGTQAEGEAWFHANGRGEAEIEGVVVRLRNGAGFLPRGVLLVTKNKHNPKPLRGCLIAVDELPEDIIPGDYLGLKGRTFFPAVPRNPAEFDRGKWLRSHGLSGELRIQSHQALKGWRISLALRRMAWIFRMELRSRIVTGLEEGSAGTVLIRGLVLGERSEGGNYYGAFRKSGTMHIFAVSGLHVGLVGALAWALIRIIRVPRRWGLLAVLLIIWIYAFVTGLNPPAMRAAFMASVFLAGFFIKRKPSLANSLLASLPVVVLLDSYQLGQVGFQLSYVVVGMIILVAPLLTRLLQPFLDGDPFLPPRLYTPGQRGILTVRRYLGGLFVVSLSAWIGSMPLIWYHFGIITPASILASVILVPLVFVILSVAFAGSLLGVVWEPFQVGVNQGNSFLAETTYHIAEKVASIPGSHFELEKAGGWSGDILIFDLWDGDAAIYVGAGEGALIDGGAPDQFRRVVKPALERSGVAPLSIVLTHPEKGHAGGLVRALERYSPRRVLLPVRQANSPVFNQLLAASLEMGSELHFGEAGARYKLGDGAEIEILRVANEETGSRADDRCMVMRLHWRGWRILITGDAGFDTEQEILGSGIDPGCDLWVMGRHRSDHTGTIGFLQAADPRVIIAEEDRYPEAERVPERWAEAVEQSGIELWRQGETGAVTIKVSEQALELQSIRNPNKRRVLRK